MSKTFPHIHEEHPDGSRLVLRCAGLDGGCGEKVELLSQAARLGQRTWPGFVQFWREHAGCAQAEPGPPFVPDDDPRMAAFCERTGHRPEKVRELIAQGVIAP